MWDFLFENNETGDYFFVECETIEEAWDTVYETFGSLTDCDFINMYTVEEAEEMGYDTL